MKQGDTVHDNQTGKDEIVLDATANSFYITQKKLSEHGIDCRQWFSDDKKFRERFTVKTPQP